jgi:hypothetical protein
MFNWKPSVFNTLFYQETPLKRSFTMTLPLFFKRKFSALFFGALAMGLLVLTGCPQETGGDSGSDLPLSAPLVVQVTANDQSLVLQWTRVVALQGVDPTYTVYYGTSSNPEKALKWPEPVIAGETNLVRVTLTGIDNHLTYYVWVSCNYAGFGESPLCPTAYGMPVPPPASVGALAISPGDGMLQLSWETVEDAFTYEVHYQSGESGLPEPPAETAADMQTVSVPGAVLLGLSTGQTYTVWIRASNTAGKSPAWRTGTGKPAAATGIPARPPKELTISPGDGKLSVSWEPLVGVPQYKVWYGAADNFDAATVLEEPVPTAAALVSAEITGLTNGTLYHIWVKSSNSVGESVAPVTATGTPQPKPPIDRSNPDFLLGYATAEYPWAQDVPPSVFTGPDGWHGTDRLTRVQETAIGNLFTDGGLWYARKLYPQETIDFAYLNGGAIEGGLLAGKKITHAAMTLIMQSAAKGDKYILLSIKGDKLKLFFHEVASTIPHTGRGSGSTGEFGMVSKEVCYTIQYPKPPEGTAELPSEDRSVYYYGRIKAGTLKFNGEDIDDNRTYRIVTSDWCHQAYITLFQHGSNVVPTDIPYYYGVEEYIYDKVNVTPYLDGRVKLEGGVPLPPPWVPGDWILE